MRYDHGLDDDTMFDLIGATLSAADELEKTLGREPGSTQYRYEDPVGPKVRVCLDSDLVVDFVAAWFFEEDEPDDSHRVGWTVWDQPRDLDLGDVMGTSLSPKAAAADVMRALTFHGWLRGTTVTYAEDRANLCVCDHPIRVHQTGEGRWTGFCCEDDCDCESPVPAGEG